MGIVCSAFSGIDLCTSRLANWFLCCVVLGGIMSFMQISVIYGMTIGYHTGQEQLAYFAARARNVQSTTRFSGPLLRAGTEVERRTEPFSPDTTTTTTTTPPETTESVLGLEMYETRPRARTGSRDENGTPIFIQYVDIVVSWLCCAMVLVVILLMIIVLTLYGITLGYHYAQKEIARFAAGEEGGGTESGLLREGEAQQQEIVEPLVRLVAVNRTQPETSGDMPGSFDVRTVSAQPLYLDSTPTPLVVLESERPIKEVELTPHEKELALKLIGRFRRIKRNNYTSYSPPTSRHEDSITTSAA